MLYDNRALVFHFESIFVLTYPYRSQPIRALLAFWTWKWAHADIAEKQKYATLINKSMPDIYLFPVKPISTVPSSNSNAISTTAASTPAANTDPEKQSTIPIPADSVETVSSNQIPKNKEIPSGENDVEVIIISEDQNSITISSKEQNNNSNSIISEQSMNAATPTWKWYTILALLNGQCIFQYPITVVMWMYAAKAHVRPGWVIALFLPLSFLCGIVSGLWPALMTMDRKKRLAAAAAAQSS